MLIGRKLCGCGADLLETLGHRGERGGVLFDTLDSAAHRREVLGVRRDSLQLLGEHWQNAERADYLGGQ
jgi:hypothetical protein